MLESKEKLIDGVTFQVTPFPAFAGLKMKARVASVIVPVFAKAAPELVKGGEIVADVGGIDIGKILPAITALTDRLKPEEFAQLCLDLLAGATAILPAIGGALEKVPLNSEAAFNKVFDGRLNVVYKAIYLVLETNDFFGFGGIMRALVAKGEAALAIKNRPPESSPKN